MNPTEIVPFPIPSSLAVSADCLADRVILVTGASGSLGRTAALSFAAHGATVVLHGRKSSKLEALYDEIETAGYAEPAILALDYLKAVDSDYKGMADTVNATFKRLDGIFHAAGHIAPLSPLALQDLAAWQAHCTINLVAPIAVTRACLPLLKRAPRGTVVFLSETHALHPKAFWGAFSASKASLQYTAAIWNDELDGESQLRMRVLVPGPVATQCRAITHPGELASTIAQPSSLESAFLLLASADARLPDATLYGLE
jgi:NAD(P)-dependent dehydrogenase (short-subunit alcohol dehydrogenase family)